MPVVRRPGQRGGGRGGQRSPWRRRLAWTVALAVALAALFALSLSQSLTGPLNSDGASNILQAQSMLHGNPLLRGWWTSDVSFYTTELPEYVLVVALRGLSPDVVHIGGALTFTLTVALAGLLARGRATGGAGLRRAGLAVAIMLAPSILGGTGVFLENPDHFGTSVPVLLLLLVLDWGEGRDEVTAPRWYVPVAACALLAWTQVGDQLSLAAATVPVAAVCAFRLAVTLIRRRPRVELRWDGLLAAAALISVAVARIAGRALRFARERGPRGAGCGAPSAWGVGWGERPAGHPLQVVARVVDLTGKWRAAVNQFVLGDYRPAFDEAGLRSTPPPTSPRRSSRQRFR